MAVAGASHGGTLAAVLCQQRSRLGLSQPAAQVLIYFDPLRDEGEAYATRLQNAGVPVCYRCEDDLSHSFTSLLRLDRPRRASLQIADDIAAMLG